MYNNGNINQDLYSSAARSILQHNPSLDPVVMEIVAMLKRYKDSVFPVAYTVSNAFTVAGATSQKLQISVDASYSFICTGMTCVANAGSDKDILLATLMLNNGYNFIYSPKPLYPVQICTQGPYPWNMYVPYSSNLFLSITNGTTTATNTVYVTFDGMKVPKFVIDILDKALSTTQQ